MTRLTGKTALITGGSSGIGLAAAKKFVDEGATVFIVGRREEELKKAAGSIGSSVIPIVADVSNADDQTRIVATIKDQRGGLDIFVSNAGVNPSQPLGSVTEEAFDRAHSINVRGLVFLMQKCLPIFRDGGSVVLIGSIVGFKGVIGYTGYGTTKAGIRSLARTWTNELKDRRIRVNTISPGFIDTPMLAAYQTDDDSAAMRNAMIAMVPFGRLGQPEEVADAALFLASDESSYICGAELVIDGGMTAI